MSGVSIVDVDSGLTLIAGVVEDSIVAVAACGEEAAADFHPLDHRWARLEDPWEW